MGIATGTRLGRYEVRAPIGAGGMGEVFSAVDTVLARNVAIKIVSDRLTPDRDARLRFEREMRLLASLSHPNVLAIHDFGETAGIVYAVMELLEGETLRQRMRDGLLPPAVAVPLALDIARGLAAAHAKGIVHRDLKPENVFLTSGGQVKILDFGLACLDPATSVKGANAETALETRPGTLLGTVGYMAPEQLRGLEVDARCDVFAFGVMFYEMLTGRRPFGTGTPAEILSAVLTHEPAPLPASLASVDTVVRGCLHKQPPGRYPSAQPLVPAIEAIQASGLGQRATSSPAHVVAATAVPIDRPAAAGSIAVLPFADMSEGRTLEYLCEGIAEEILLALTRVDGLRVVARSSSFRFKSSSDDVRTVGQTLGVAYVLEGSVRSAGDRLRVVTQLVNSADGYQLWSERFDRGRDDIFAVQDEIARATASTLHVRLRGSSGIDRLPPVPAASKAYELYLRGRHHWNRRTEADLHKSIECFTASIADDPGYAHAHAGLAEAYVTLGIYGALSPHEAMPLARAAAERAVAIGPPLPGALAALGCVRALFDWDWTDAERLFRLGVDSLPGASSARAWYALNHLVPTGRFGEAEAELRRALAVDPLSLPINAGLGVCAYFARDYDQAVRGLSAALDLDRGFAMARYFLGLTLTELGRHDDAVTAIGQAIDASGGSPEMTAAAGYVLGRAGHVDGAGLRLAELRALSQTRYVSPGLIAQVHAGRGDTGEALAWLERALEVRAADVAWLGVRPSFDAVRADPRCAAFCERIGARLSRRAPATLRGEG